MMTTPCNCAEQMRVSRERKRIWNQGRTRADHEGSYIIRNQEGVINEIGAATYSAIDWGSAKTAVLSPLHNLLSPPGLPCLTCGKTISGKVKGYPEICSSCYASIPWITHARCEVCGRPVGCPDCTRAGGAPRRFVLNRSAVAYNGTMRDWLAQYKFRGHEALGSVLARMTGLAAKRMIKELGEPRSSGVFRFDAVTYVPVSTERMMERGFNQARTLAQEAAVMNGLPLLELLERTQHTEKQSFKSRWQRLRDLQGIFDSVPEAEDRLDAVIQSPKRSSAFPLSLFAAESRISQDAYAAAPVKLLLVDDVYTTGSTIDTCAEILHQLCASLGRTAEIYSLTWARS